MTKPVTTLEVRDIYLRNGILTADAIQDGKPTMFNMNLGGVYAEAVMEYIKKVSNDKTN